jgi:hypothetical protein
VATKLAVWNAALNEIGDYELADTGEAIDAGRVLAARWDRVVADCLASGSWNFAMETIRADADTGVTPEFGFRQVFAKPSDWVRTIGVSEDEYFSFPLLHYYDDASYWSSDNSPVYIRYVSDDTGLGLEMTRWPAAFTRFVELELAHRSCLRINQSGSLKDAIGKERDKARKAALNQDAMNENQPKFPPPSSWTMARGGRIARGDRGNRGSLTG